MVCPRVSSSNEPIGILVGALRVCLTVLRTVKGLVMCRCLVLFGVSVLSLCSVRSVEFTELGVGCLRMWKVVGSALL